MFIQERPSLFHSKTLCRYYFVNGHALNDKPRLAKVVAEELQKLLSDKAPTEENILEFLNGNEGRKEIESTLKVLQEMGVHGIPKFVIEGQTVVDGAAKSDEFIDIFRDIEQRGFIANGPIFARVLGIPSDVVNRVARDEMEAA